MALDRTRLTENEKISLARGYISPSQMEEALKREDIFNYARERYRLVIVERNKLGRKLTVERMRYVKYLRLMKPLEEEMNKYFFILDGIRRRRDLFDEEFKKRIQLWDESRKNASFLDDFNGIRVSGWD